MSTDYLKELREAKNDMRIPASGADDVRIALRKASLAVKNWSDTSEAFRYEGSQPPGHRIIDAALDVVQAFIDWAEGEGKKYGQVKTLHIDVCKSFIEMLEQLLTRAGLHPTRLKPEHYYENLRKLVIFSKARPSGRPQGRFDDEPFDESNALEFVTLHWPGSLIDLAAAVESGQVPLDPYGAAMAHRFIKLAAIINSDRLLKAAPGQ